MSSKVDDWMMQQAEFAARLDAYSEAQERLTKTIKSMGSKKLNLKQGSELVGSWEVHVNKLGDMLVVRAKLNQSVIFARESYEKIKKLAVLYFFMQIVSLVVFVVGIYLWYFKTQKYLDLKESIIPTVAVKPRLKDRLPRRSAQ